LRNSPFDKQFLSIPEHKGKNPHAHLIDLIVFQQRLFPATSSLIDSIRHNLKLFGSSSRQLILPALQSGNSYYDRLPFRLIFTL